LKPVYGILQVPPSLAQSQYSRSGPLTEAETLQGALSL
jgi:hypothetical protein